MKKKTLPVIIILLLLLLAVAGFVVPRLIERFSYSKERADLSAYFNLSSEEEVPVLWQGELTEIKARVKDGRCYFAFDTVQEYLNNRFYDGKEDGTLLYTTSTTVYTSPVGGTSRAGSDGFAMDEGYALSFREGETLYVALDYVKQYTDFSYEYYAGPDRILLRTEQETYPSAVLTKDTALRVRGGVKSEIVEDLHRDDTVFILEEMDTWTKVMTTNAFIGYVENKRLFAGQEMVFDVPKEIAEEEDTSVFKPYPICLAWHNVAGMAGNDTLRGYVQDAKCLNVVSPTWYSLSHDDGSFQSFSSAAYVSEAHALGLDVWALISDLDYKDTISDYAILSKADTRAGLIANLMKEADATGFDGINVDFEFINEETGESYIQFLRELKIACAQKGLVLSTDNYVPRHYNRQYHRERQAQIVDYFIIMGYDEHGTFSDEAGSVSSIDYVTQGIMQTLEEVPAEKIINAVPFYTRIWVTENGNLTSSALGIRQATDFIQSHAIPLAWDEISGQNYGEKTEGSKTYRVWMEDDESLAVKLSAMEYHGIAGVAAWKLGFELPSNWDTIAAYVQR